MAKLGRSDSVSESLREIVHVYFTITFFSWVSLEVVLSCVWLFVTPRTVVLQVPLSMGIPRQEYRSRVLFPTPEDLTNPGIELESPALQVDYLSLSHLGSLSLVVDPKINIWVQDVYLGGDPRKGRKRKETNIMVHYWAGYHCGQLGLTPSGWFQERPRGTWHSDPCSL